MYLSLLHIHKEIHDFSLFLQMNEEIKCDRMVQMTESFRPSEHNFGFLLLEWTWKPLEGYTMKFHTLLMDLMFQPAPFSEYALFIPLKGLTNWVYGSIHIFRRGH